MNQKSVYLSDFAFAKFFNTVHRVCLKIFSDLEHYHYALKRLCFYHRLSVAEAFLDHWFQDWNLVLTHYLWLYFLKVGLECIDCFLETTWIRVV